MSPVNADFTYEKNDYNNFLFMSLCFLNASQTHVIQMSREERHGNRDKAENLQRKADP